MFLPWLGIEVSYLDLLWNLIVFNRAKESQPSLSDASLGSFVSLTRSVEADDVTKPQVPVNIKSSEAPRLWALIIGINEYIYPTPDLEKLKGAAPDADAMDQYLRTSLNVPESQIVNLRNHQATRNKIIAAFHGLRDNLRINYQDPILIYYAGHGSELPLKEGKVQTLVPADYLAGKTKPIPDRTVAALINGIAKRHGNNITVIFDCCHSGSGTRGDGQRGDTLVRGCTLRPDDVPKDLDAAICKDYPEAEFKARGMRFAEGFSVQGMKSHILLAACSANELALEDKSPEAHGRFTTALLRLFKEIGPDQMTYADVLSKISRIEGQNPQCEGYHRDRILFDAKVRPPTRRCYDVKPVKGKSTCMLEGGKAHGITDGAQFTLYSDQAAVGTGTPLGVMVAKGPNIKPFKSILEPVENGAPRLTGPAVAIQTKAGVSEDLIIHAPLEDEYMPVFQAIAREMSGDGPDPCRIRLVGEDSEAAQLKMTHHQQGRLGLIPLDPLAKKHGFTRMPYTVDSDEDDLRRILRAAAHYNFHLNLNHENNQIKGKIKIEFFPLEEDYDDNCEIVLSPREGENMLSQDGTIEYDIEEDTKYGMRIKNETPWDLHYACFFFDHADFSITALSEVNTKTQFSKDHNLKKDSEVEIGYGSSGVPPIETAIPGNLNVTIGFLKFYFTSEAVDLSHVPQKSPFSETRSMKQTPEGQKKDGPVWGTILIPVIQKRAQ
ncbi:hypothetical protein MD484_g4547, partial [Candolleomyces efflorescens]